MGPPMVKPYTLWWLMGFLLGSLFSASVRLLNHSLESNIGIAHKLVGIAVERAGARFGGYQDLSASGASIAGIIVAALQSKLLDCVHVGRVDNSAVGAGVVDVGAVNGPVVGRGASSVHRHRCVAGAGFVAHLAHDAGLEGDELLEVAAREFKPARSVRRVRLPACAAGFRVDCNRGGFDRDRGARLSQL